MRSNRMQTQASNIEKARRDVTSGKMEPAVAGAISKRWGAQGTAILQLRDPPAPST
jgi:hypothetical protein